jgi:hypothetical protein
LNHSIANLKAVKINKFLFWLFVFVAIIVATRGASFHIFIFSRASFFSFKENLERQEEKLFHA